MSMDPDNIAEIERDLMLNYMQQLYACYLSDAKPAARTVAPKKYVRSTPTPTPKPKPKPTPKVVVQETPPPPPPPAPAPVKAKVEPVIKKSTPPPPPPAPVEKAPEIKKAPVVKATPSRATSSGDLDVLFEQTAAKELSEKLSSLPIKDLNKALGLNEKMLTINELFSGDATVYNETMSALNGLRTFDEASTFLKNHIIKKYNWTAKGKKAKAKEFIKLIRRRYN